MQAAVESLMERTTHQIGRFEARSSRSHEGNDESRFVGPSATYLSFMVQHPRPTTAGHIAPRDVHSKLHSSCVNLINRVLEAGWKDFGIRNQISICISTTTPTIVDMEADISRGHQSEIHKVIDIVGNVCLVDAACQRIPGAPAHGWLRIRVGIRS